MEIAVLIFIGIVSMAFWSCVTYKYLSPLMSNTTITFIDNKQVVLGTGSSVGKYFKITPSVVDGSIVWVATEV